MTKPWKWLSITRPYWQATVLSRASRGVRLAVAETIEDYDTIVYPGCDRETAVLEAIRALESLRVQLSEELHLLVVEARSEGASWGQIGKQLGCSRQAAHQRFGSGLSSDQVSRLDDEIFEVRRWAETMDLKYGSDEEFDNAILFLEEQEELDQGRRL